jgi:hypothetical protein
MFRYKETGALMIMPMSCGKCNRLGTYNRQQVIYKFYAYWSAKNGNDTYRLQADFRTRNINTEKTDKEFYAVNYGIAERNSPA